MGEVVGLYTAPAAGEPMVSHVEVELVAGHGVAGDRYLLHTGHWSDPRWPDQELTIFEAEVAERLGIEPSAVRRNIVLRGQPLADLTGAEFRLGTALLRGVRHCDPCRYIETLTRPGLMAALGTSGGGLRCAILEGGVVRLGDTVEQVTAPARAPSASA